MLDLALNANHDIYYDPATKDIAMVAGVDRVRQSISIALKLFLGEWFDNLDAGVSYFQYILAKAETYSDTATRGVATMTVESVLRKAILAVVSVDSILSFSLTLDRATRSASVASEVKSSEGVVSISEVFP